MHEVKKKKKKRATADPDPDPIGAVPEPILPCSGGCFFDYESNNDCDSLDR